jgi:hypothetical protein
MKQYYLSKIGRKYEEFNPKYNMFSKCYDD